MLLRNFRFRTKLIVGFAILIGFSIIITIIALFQLNQIKKNTDLIYKHPLAVSNAVRDINTSINGMHRSMKDLIIAENSVQVERAITQLNIYKKRVFADFDIVFGRFLGDRKDVENTYKAFLDSEKIRTEVISLKKQGRDKEALAVLTEKGEKHIKYLFEKIQIMADFAESKANEFKEESEKTYIKTFNALLYAIIAIVVLSILMSLMISRSILNPIKEFVSNIRALYLKGRGTYSESDFKTEEDLLFVTVSELKNAYRQIEEANNELNILNKSLDERVKGRTTELQKKQKELKLKNEEYAAVNEEYISINEDLNKTNKELIQAKEEIEKSEQRFSMLMQQSPLVIEIYALDGLQIEVNKIYEELWGFPASRTVNKYNVLKSKEVKDTGLLAYVKKAYNGETVSVPEYEFDPTGDTEAQGVGRVRWLSTKIYPLKDSSGQVANIVITHEDITERKHAEQALALSKTHYQTLFDNSPVPLWEEDFGDLFRYLEDKKKRGITDFDSYFDKHPEELKICSQKIKIVDVNKATIKLHKAKDKKDLLGNLDKIFTKKSFEVFKEELIAIANGKLKFEAEGEVQTLKGEARHVFLKLTINKEQTGLKRAILATEDITERKLVVDKIKIQSEIMANMSEAVYLVRMRDGLIVYANEEFEKMFGYANDEMLEKHVSIVNAKTDRVPEETAKEIMAVLIKEGKWEGEVHNVKKDGTKFWCYARVSVFAHPQYGEVLISVHRDITERKQAEKALRISEKEYRTLVDNIPGVTYRCANDKFYTMDYLSDEVKKLTGYPGSDFLNNDVRSFMSIIYPEDIRFVHDTIHEGVSERRPYVIEYRIVNAGGEIRWVFEKGQAIFDSKNKVKYLEGVIIDITERKRSEEIQKCLYNISNAVITTDNLEELVGRIQQELGKIIDTKNFYIALYDYETDTFTLPFFSDEKDKEMSDPAGKSLAKFVIKTRKSLLANIDLKKKLMKEGKIDPIGSLSKIWLGVPLKIEKEVIGVLAVQSYTDEFAYNDSDMEMLEFISDQISITIQRKKTEEELIKAKEKAEESDRLKSAFLANMSHEIRTPMNGIIGFANLLKKPGTSPEKLDHFTNVIVESSSQLLRVVNDILDISKIETGQMEISHEEVSINKIISETYAFYELRAKEQDIALNVYKESKDENVKVITDYAKLKQTLFNLLNNAFKFTEKGSIDFGYKVKNKQLEFFVKDTGIGIHKRDHHKVFMRFSQMENTFSRLYGGTGLGLAICKGYVEALGGNIRFISKEHKGSEFYFTIPFIKTRKVEGGQ